MVLVAVENRLIPLNVVLPITELICKASASRSESMLATSVVE
jgi:hypothetical protein